MKKLNLFERSLAGTPLSDEELKKIVGGVEVFACSCNVTTSRYDEYVVSLNGIYSDASCAEGCADYCSEAGSAKCHEYTMSYAHWIQQ